MSLFKRRLAWIVCGALAAGVFAMPTQATMVKSTNLQDLVERADRIFVGRVVEQRVDASGLPQTIYVLEVTEPIRGVRENRVEIRQFGLVRPVRINDGLRRSTKVPGMPQYNVGEEVMLFMTGESRKGLSAPVGLEQGAFRVNNQNGKRTVLNGVGNSNLRRNLSTDWLEAMGVSPQKARAVMPDNGQPIRYADFVETVKRLSSRTPAPAQRQTLQRQR